MIVALFGATGATGRLVLERLLARGDGVRALARDPAKLAPAPGLTVTKGDARDAAAVAATLAGTEAAISCLGMADFTKPATDYSDSTATIIAAMQKSGPKRLLLIASFGVIDHPSGKLRGEVELPEMLRHVFAEHRRNYLAAKTSGLDWTLFCPGYLRHEADSAFRLAAEAVPEGGRITPYAGLAEAMVREVRENRFLRQRVGIAR
jgi:putative NADH-flavin reductase